MAMAAARKIAFMMTFSFRMNVEFFAQPDGRKPADG
jgi:hypothetical protein